MGILNPDKKITEAVRTREMRQLLRLQTLIDVVYGIILFRIFLFLPRPEVDGFGAGELVTVLKQSYLNYLVIIVGIIMVILYWSQSNLQFGNVERTNGTLAFISILQVMFLLVYFYFVRLDIEFDGAVIALQMESVFLALAGFMSVFGWYYSIRMKLVSDDLTKDDQYAVYLKLLPEPIVSVLSFPFALLGPGIWTLSWLMLIPVTMITKRIINKQKLKYSEETTDA